MYSCWGGRFYQHYLVAGQPPGEIIFYLLQALVKLWFNSLSASSPLPSPFFFRADGTPGSAKVLLFIRTALQRTKSAGSPEWEKRSRRLGCPGQHRRRANLETSGTMLKACTRRSFLRWKDISTVDDLPLKRWHRTKVERSLSARLCFHRYGHRYLINCHSDR